MNKFLTSILCTIFVLVNLYAQNLTLKVMSYNVQQPFNTSWETRKDSLVAIINDENPDIIGSQEAVDFQKDFILLETSKYAVYGSGRDEDFKGEGCRIFYKKERFELDSTKSGNFWLSDTPEKPSKFSGSWNRICTYARFTDKNSKVTFYIFNLHNYVETEKEARIKGKSLIINKIISISGNEKCIITGDFNSPEQDEVTIWLQKGKDNPLHLIDTYRQVHPDGSAKTGFGEKLDYIYVPENVKFKTKNAWIVEKHYIIASDHKPIMAVLEF